MIDRILNSNPMTTLSLSYVSIAVVLVASGVIDGSDKNVARLVIAGFLLVSAASVSIIGYTAYKLHDPRTYDGLPPKIVAFTTCAATLTILWVCVELWSRTADAHFSAPYATIAAGIGAILWCVSLAGILTYQARKARNGKKAPN